ncbi:Beta-lactamase domain-containing protein [Desulfonema limicola]|uniref:Beta-lactamase domain-containing protein n=1 Tax=Desulfonema limicola TaxID=45656 RepID=A0A975B7P7_9BACT|nr:MBL fold metallo-hydrolase [Desulfonema limicola]QTA80464.1 Beta-lactamase domain-containing protein [Desulfonema limicola]
MKKIFMSILLGFMAAAPCMAVQTFEKDIIKTAKGDLEITFIGHGTLMFKFDNKIIHVDPWTKLADYSLLPKADIILVTHEHRDHLDLKALEILQTRDTETIVTQNCYDQVKNGIIMKNGDIKQVKGLNIEAVAAYNIVHMRSKGNPFHPKGDGNGYIITFGDKKIYIAGDTENIPEMKQLKDIHAAFLPMNLPYTMTPEMTADAALSFSPEILYPYHFGETDLSIIANLLKDNKNIDLRLRNMK